MSEPLAPSLVGSGRDLTEPRLDPSGRFVAFVAREGPAASIRVVDVDDPVERALTFAVPPVPGRGLGGGCFTWVAAGDGPSIVYAAADGELWHQRGAHAVALTSLEREARAPAVADLRARPQGAHRLVAFVVDEAEVWVHDLAAGAARRVDDGRHEFCFDPAVAPDERRVSWQGWSPPDMPWDGAVRVEVDLEGGAISTWAPHDGAVQQPRYAPDGRPTMVHDGSGWLNVQLDGTPVVADEAEHAGPTWGMGVRSYAVAPDAERIAFTRNERGFGALDVVDPVTGRVVRLGRGVHGGLDWVGDRLVALRSGARTPTRVVVYDLLDGTRRTVAHAHVAAWDDVDLPEPELVEATAGDGTTVHARRFVAGHRRMLVWVHGGPTDQWQVDWRPRIPLWWSRGWDVLVVDPRGTTGHGRAYQQALRGGWGRLDVDDTADLIRHAHAQGWSAPSSTVVVGGSSGGLTVLGVLADHGDLVAGGIASYPVSDLRALAEATHRFEAHYTDTLVAPLDGSDESERRFRDLSPIDRADRITRPLLLSHGSDDPVVPVAQSRALAERIRASGGEVDLVVHEGEGHGYRDPAVVADEHARVAAFLDRVGRP